MSNIYLLSYNYNPFIFLLLGTKMSVKTCLQLRPESSVKKKYTPGPNINSNSISHTFHAMLTRARIFVFKSEFQNPWVGDHAHFGMISLITPAVTVREVSRVTG